MLSLLQPIPPNELKHGQGIVLETTIVSGVTGPTDVDVGLDLTSFERRSALEEFFRKTPSSWAEFDVLALPPALWPSLYMADVHDDDRIILSLAGDKIRSWFNRDLRGVDLCRTTHGPQSAEVVAAYKDAIVSGKPFAIRQTAFLKSQGYRVNLECGVVPLLREDTICKVVGFLYLGRLGSEFTEPDIFEIAS